MRTIRHQPIFGNLKITCRACKSDLTANNRFSGFYSCPTCDAWTTDVDKEFVAGGHSVIDFNCTA